MPNRPDVDRRLNIYSVSTKAASKPSRDLAKEQHSSTCQVSSSSNTIYVPYDTISAMPLHMTSQVMPSAYLATNDLRRERGQGSGIRDNLATGTGVWLCG
jgi:hypothetical protein